MTTIRYRYTFVEVETDMAVEMRFCTDRCSYGIFILIFSPLYVAFIVSLVYSTPITTARAIEPNILVYLVER